MTHAEHETGLGETGPLVMRVALPAATLELEFASSLLNAVKGTLDLTRALVVYTLVASPDWAHDVDGWLLEGIATLSGDANTLALGWGGERRWGYHNIEEFVEKVNEAWEIFPWVVDRIVRTSPGVLDVINQAVLILAPQVAAGLGAVGWAAVTRATIKSLPDLVRSVGEFGLGPAARSRILREAAAAAKDYQEASKLQRLAMEQMYASNGKQDTSAAQDRLVTAVLDALKGESVALRDEHRTAARTFVAHIVEGVGRDNSGPCYEAARLSELAREGRVDGPYAEPRKQSKRNQVRGRRRGR